MKGTSLRKGDWKKGGHGHTNLRKAIAESCDVYFYDLAHDLGIDRIHQALNEFGFGRNTLVDIGGESSGLLPSRQWKERVYNESWYPGETLNIGIGQGAILVTPMQLAVATAAIANRGRVVKPKFFRESRDPMSNEIVISSQPELHHVISYAESDWDSIIEAMVNRPWY